jgi:hypothetical protein
MGNSLCNRVKIKGWHKPDRLLERLLIRTRKIIDICTGMDNQCEKLFAFTWIYTIKNSRMLLQTQNRSQTLIVPHDQCRATNAGNR